MSNDHSSHPGLALATPVVVCFVAMLQPQFCQAQVSYGNAAHYPVPISERPTVSPYLHLTNQAFNQNGIAQFGGVYQTLVRPQLQQRQIIADQQRELNRVQSHLAEVEGRLQRQLSSGPAQTGHGARFMSFSHFYPQKAAHQHR